MALKERYAGSAHPMRFEMGAARGLIKWKRARRKMVPIAKNALGTCVCCSNVFRTGYFESCTTERGRSESKSGGARAKADLLVELVEMVVDLVLGLNEDRVLLELLRRGHLGAQ